MSQSRPSHKRAPSSYLFNTRKALGLFAVFLSITTFSCKKEESALGREILPDEDLLGVTVVDTFTLLTGATLEDSIKSDDINRGIQLVGSVNDPVFGTTVASFAGQVRIPENNVVFGTQLSLDSIFLNLVIFGYRGDPGTKGPAQPQTFTVYELDESLSTEEDYYATDTILVKPVPIGKVVNHVINATDSLNVGSEKAPAMVRIRLSKEFGEKLLFASSSALANNDNFLNLLKGIYITSENNFTPGNGAVVVFSVFDTWSGIQMYYKDDVTPKTYDFAFNKSSARVNLFRHSYSGTPAGLALSSSAAYGQAAYVQGMAGVKGVLNVPYLENLNGLGNVMVNKAELILPVNTNDPGYTIYGPVEQLVLVSAGENNENITVLDYFEDQAYFGGVYDPALKAYKFNIAREVNAILRGNKKNNGFFLVPFANVISPTRTTILGADPANTGARLVVYYTKF